MRAAGIALAALLLATSARADPDEPAASAASPAHPGPWAARARTAYAFLGPHERPTGGMMITGDVGRSWTLGSVSLGLGGELSAFGFDTGGRWTAILGGLVVESAARVSGPWRAGLTLHLDAGRLPTCTRWGLCMQFAGLFPAASGSIRYEPSVRVALALSGGARLVRTLAWNGLGGEGGIAATFRF